MTFVSALEADRVFRENGLKTVNSVIISRLFKLTNQNTVYKLLQRLVDKKVLTRGRNGLYFVVASNPGAFFIANTLISPSYISLESALNFYGILPQFPYAITSVTVKRGRTINFDNREFIYRSIASKQYSGFVKIDDYLIATPEKAVLDFLYFKPKADFSDWDLSLFDKDWLKKNNIL